MVVPPGTHQFTACSCSTKAAKTSSRGASNKRVTTISRSAVVSFIMFPPSDNQFAPQIAFIECVRSGRPAAASTVPLSLKLAQIFFQAVEAFFPVPAISLQPMERILQGRGLQSRRPPLGLAAALDQP